MSSIKFFKDLALNGVVGPKTLAGATAAQFTNGIPCRGATMVVVRWKSTNAITPASVTFNVGEGASRAHQFSNLAGAGLANPLGNIGLRADQHPGGCAVALFPATASKGRFHCSFVQFSITPNAGVSPANDMTGVTIDAEVHYDGDADAARLENEQNIDPLTT